MHYYTYAYLREDRTPYYIGKGKGDRIYSKSRRIKPPKDKSRIIYLKQNLTEEEAFRHEIYMIDVFGRKDLGTGILQNLTNGGDGSSGWVPSEETRKKMSGRIPSEETRAKMSEARKGEKNHNYGKTHSVETRKKISESQIGKTLSKEHIEKIIEGLKGKTHSEETRKKMSEALIGNTRALGKTLSEEHRRKISEYHKNKYVSEETRRKIGAASKGRTKGRKWWNDGCGKCKMMLECPGDGWKLGRK